MSKAAKSVLVFGIYLAVTGLGFLIMPNTPLALFGFPPTNEVWIRIMGLLIMILGYFYIQSARADFKPFFQWTVNERIAAVVVFAIFVALGLAEPTLLIFGAVDLLGAIWTQLALRSS